MCGLLVGNFAGVLFEERKDYGTTAPERGAQKGKWQ